MHKTSLGKFIGLTHIILKILMKFAEMCMPIEKNFSINTPTRLGNILVKLLE